MQMITDLEFRIMCAILSDTADKYASGVAPWAIGVDGLRLYVDSLPLYLKDDYTETEIRECVSGLEEKGMLVVECVKYGNYDDLCYRLTAFGMSILVAELAREERECSSTNTKKSKATIHIEHNTGDINIS